MAWSVRRAGTAAADAASPAEKGGALRRWLLRHAKPYEVPGATGDAWIIYAHQKSARIEGRLACPLVDPLIEGQPEGSRTYLTLGRLSEPEVVPSRPLDLRPGLLELLCAQWLAGPPSFGDLRFLNRLYGPQLCFPRRWRRLHVLRTWLLARHFTVKFSALAEACRAAHVTVYYNAPMLGVVAAFRRLGKPVWDVQHGYLGPSHEAYSNATAWALPSALKPSGFVVWDERFGRHVESTLGAPWRSTDYAHLKMFLRLAPPRAPGRRRVLFTLQWETPVPPSVIAAATRPGALEWVFRMHPADRSDRPDLQALRAAPQVSIVDCRDPLALAIASADVHVTVNSSVVHEAAVLGVPSIFFDPICRERFDSESGRGLAQFTDDAAFDGHLQRLTAPGAR